MILLSCRPDVFIKILEINKTGFVNLVNVWIGLKLEKRRKKQQYVKLYHNFIVCSYMQEKFRFYFIYSNKFILLNSLIN